MPGAVDPGFVVWLTGLPGSGKSTVADALEGDLAARGIRAARLESDVVRRVFYPRPTYGEEERDAFYAGLVWLASLLARHGVPVVIDATAHRREYRRRARERLPRYFEVFLDCPLEVCESRDPKGIYRLGRRSPDARVPGLQVAYEPPEHPELIAHGVEETAEAVASRILAQLELRQWL